MYSSIYDLCEVRNEGPVFDNEPGMATPRVIWICNFIESNFPDIDFELQDFQGGGTTCYNVILTGSSNKWVTCHHDIVNMNSNNAQDNSCSIINAIMLKSIAPHINVAILDGEEFGGIGSTYLSNKMLNGDYGVVDWILNLELTGLGGKEFLICSSNLDKPLSTKVRNLFKCDIVNVPFNDSVIFRSNGFDSIVINPLPRLDNGELDISILYICHSIEDTVDKISIEDMKIFTEEILLPIVS